ncbi:sensor histidine kinase [Noviherbaspirillum soli]|uniref:sensor histidine kinase n=1 Tax=Noviherbaspirillum soli TaxID=1064518 RepID=UPI00188C3961|nr:PAS domain-containing sensor histidine kinase [Noviherbaspirillum soli]
MPEHIFDPVEPRHASELDYRTLFAQLPTPYLVLSADLTIVAANHAYLHRSQVVIDDIVGKNLFEAFQEHAHGPNAITLANLRASLNRVVQGRAPDTMAVQKYDLPGVEPGLFEERYWSPVNTPVFDEQGDLTHIIHRVEDVTQFMQRQTGVNGLAPEVELQAMEIQGANQNLQEAKERLDQLVSERTHALNAEREYLHSLLMAVPVPVSVLLGPEHRFYLENDAHRVMSAGRELVGKTFREAVPDAVDDVLPILDSVFQTGQPFWANQQRIVWDAERTGKANEHFYDLSWHPLLGEDRKVKGVITATIDVTKQVRTDAAIRAALAGLEQERALREQFVVTLTHDLRTPLAAAQMGSSLISRKADNPVEVVKLTGRVIRNLDRIDQMIRDLLDANRIRAGETLPIKVGHCELRGLVSETLDELATIHGNRFDLQAMEPIEGYWCMSAIRRLLENLCGNAIKYGAAVRPVTVRLLRHGAMQARIEVHNEGPAIPMQDQLNMFQPFRRNESDGLASQRGWGLGLTVVRGISEAHGGTVEVESAAELGTTFRVTLPLDARSTQ